MYGEISPQLIEIPSIRDIEATHLSEIKDKWVLVTTNLLKNRAQLEIDIIIKNYDIPDSVTHPPGRAPSKLVNEAVVSYAIMLQNNTDATVFLLQ